MTAFSAAPSLDEQARRAVTAALGSTPRGLAFGRLVEPAAWLAACQGQVPARRIERARVVIFSGEHGIAHRQFEGAGLSAFAPEATQEQIAEIKNNEGPIHTFARNAGAGISLVECGNSGAVDSQDAMSAEVLKAALDAGAQAADREIDAGADLLIPADIGVGNTTIAAIVMGLLTHTEPVAIVGPGSGTTDAMWKTKVLVIRDAMFRARHLAQQPQALLQSVTSPDFAAQVGFIIQAAARRTPLLIDGAFTAAAAVVAERMAAGSQAWMYAAGITTEPAHHLALQDLRLQPLLSLDMHAGSGFGALSALPLIQSGVELAADEVIAVSAAMNTTGSESIDESS